MNLEKKIFSLLFITFLALNLRFPPSVLTHDTGFENKFTGLTHDNKGNPLSHANGVYGILSDHFIGGFSDLVEFHHHIPNGPHQNEPVYSTGPSLILGVYTNSLSPDLITIFKTEEQKERYIEEREDLDANNTEVDPNLVIEGPTSLKFEAKHLPNNSNKISLLFVSVVQTDPQPPVGPYVPSNTIPMKDFVSGTVLPPPLPSLPPSLESYSGIVEEICVDPKSPPFVVNHVTCQEYLNTEKFSKLNSKCNCSI